MSINDFLTNLARERGQELADFPNTVNAGDSVVIGFIESAVDPATWDMKQILLVPNDGSQRADEILDALAERGLFVGGVLIFVDTRAIDATDIGATGVCEYLQHVKSRLIHIKLHKAGKKIQCPHLGLNEPPAVVYKRYPRIEEILDEIVDTMHAM